MDVNADFLHIGLDFIPSKPITEKEKFYTENRDKLKNIEIICNNESDEEEDIDDGLNNMTTDERKSIESFSNYDNTFSIEEVVLDGIRAKPLINNNIKLYIGIRNTLIDMINFINTRIKYIENLNLIPYYNNTENKIDMNDNKIGAMLILYKNLILSQSNVNLTDYNWNSANTDKLILDLGEISTFCRTLLLSDFTFDSFEFKSLLKRLPNSVMEFLNMSYPNFSERLYTEDKTIYEDINKLNNILRKNKFIFYNKIYGIQNRDNSNPFKNFDQIMNILNKTYTVRDLIKPENLRGFYDHNSYKYWDDLVSKFNQKQELSTFKELKMMNNVLSFVFECLITIYQANNSLMLDIERIITNIYPTKY